MRLLAPLYRDRKHDFLFPVCRIVFIEEYQVSSTDFNFRFFLGPFLKAVGFQRTLSERKGKGNFLGYLCV